MELQQYLEVAVNAAKAAGVVIQDAWDKPRNVVHKGTADLVTETDKECEKLIVDYIKTKFPDHCFIGEEDSSVKGTADLTPEPTWMIDPVDGTTNFVHKFPFVCVCIGLAIEKKVVVGVVYNPVLNEMFTAVQGGGAHLNGNPIHVSDATDIQHALLSTEIGTKRDHETVAVIFERICKAVEAARSIRSVGSCALNMVSVALGRLDAFFEIGFGGPWDVAAGSIIVTEAGGTVLDPAGGRFDVMSCRVLCGTPSIAQHLAQIIKGCKTSSKEPSVPTLE